MKQAVDQARAAAEQQAWPTAISHQQEAVSQARTLARLTRARDALVQLSVLLYNLAGYYQQANRHAEAVTCYEEVVAIDKQTGHEDLASDEQALAQARQLAASEAGGGVETEATLPSLPTHLEALLSQLSPEDRAKLAQMGPEDQEKVLQAIAHFAALPEEEQAALVARSHFQQVESQIVAQLTQLWTAIDAGELTTADQEATASNIVEAITTIEADDSLGSQRHDLAALLRCAAARLRQEALPPIPAMYAEQWAAWTDT